MDGSDSTGSDSENDLDNDYDVIEEALRMVRPDGCSTASVHSSSSNAASLQPLKNRLAKLDAQMERQSKISAVDKSDRATSEQVLDPRTRLILFKLLNTRVITTMHGCISTGKEANVYYAVREVDGVKEERAIKVYKTSILVFKDRDQYVSGEFRFRTGYSRHNPRKMVRTWAEKEMRNLKRLFQSGFLCPEPLLLRQHVLVMSFMGEDGIPYPRLKDVDFISATSSKWGDIYLSVIAGMYRLFHLCRLVHADLSEYNLLLTPSLEVVWIDVSQSVEMDHPRSLDFLRMDIRNVSSFFKRHEVQTLKMRVVFDLLTQRHPVPEGWVEADVDGFMEGFYAAVETLKSDPSNFSGLGDRDDDDAVEQLVFEQTFIPRQVDDLVDFENEASNQLHLFQQYAGAVASVASSARSHTVKTTRDEGESAASVATESHPPESASATGHSCDNNPLETGRADDAAVGRSDSKSNSDDDDDDDDDDDNNSNNNSNNNNNDDDDSGNKDGVAESGVEGDGKNGGINRKREKKGQQRKPKDVSSASRGSKNSQFSLQMTPQFQQSASSPFQPSKRLAEDSHPTIPLKRRREMSLDIRGGPQHQLSASSSSNLLSTGSNTGGLRMFAPTIVSPSSLLPSSMGSSLIHPTSASGHPSLFGPPSLQSVPHNIGHTSHAGSGSMGMPPIPMSTSGLGPNAIPGLVTPTGMFISPTTPFSKEDWWK
nr:serine/threonine-protein kinase RIO1 [Andalucia godoyi]